MRRSLCKVPIGNNCRRYGLAGPPMPGTGSLKPGNAVRALELFYGQRSPRWHLYLTTPPSFGLVKPRKQQRAVIIISKSSNGIFHGKVFREKDFAEGKT